MASQGEVVEVTGPVSYKVRIDKDGKIVRRHQDQLRKGCTTIVPEQSSQVELSTQDDYIFPSTMSNDHTEPSVLKLHQSGSQLVSGNHLRDLCYS